MILSGCRALYDSAKYYSSFINSAVSIEPEELIYLEDIGLPIFTSTGLAYAPVCDTYWVGDHGSEPTDRVQLFQISSDMTSIISCVQIDDYCNVGGDKSTRCSI